MKGKDMTKISKETISTWTDRVEQALPFIVRQEFKDITRLDVKTGVDAWGIAHAANISMEAYNDFNANDAHIQTALEKIFPNAVFKDKKRY